MLSAGDKAAISALVGHYRLAAEVLLEVARRPSASGRERTVVEFDERGRADTSVSLELPPSIAALAHALGKPGDLAGLLGGVAGEEVEEGLVVDLAAGPPFLHGLEDGAVVGLLAVVVEVGRAQEVDDVPVILGEGEAIGCRDRFGGVLVPVVV